jgi:CubicO group peptidase (beta-lactamase class C family)
MRLRPGDPEEVGMSTQRVQHIVDLAEGWVAQGIHPALVVLVARRGVIVIHEAFGHLAPEQDSPPLELDSIYPLASLTKPITATAAMILVEDGLLGLNRPVSWYIPEFTGEGKDSVMVHHLLTHTSGLREEDVNAHAKKRGTVEIPPPDDTQPARAHEHLFLRYDAPLWKPPGAEMSYCSYGYKLVGEIVRRVSGRSFHDFARERIFEPLGMKDTYYITPDSMRHRIVKHHADGPYPWLGSRRHQEGYYASGGVCSTAIDMAVFGQMFLNRGTYGDTRILSLASVAEMTRNQIPGISARRGNEFFPEASWSFSWNVHGSKKEVVKGTLQSPKAFCHGGMGGVFLWIDPVYEIVGVYFSVKFSEDAHCVDLFTNAVTAAVVDV